MSTDPLQANGQTPSRAPPIGFLLVLILAGFFYAGMVACLVDGDSDAYGRSLDAALAVLSGLVTWSLLGILLWIAAVKGEMPRIIAIFGFVMLPLSAIAAATAVDPGPHAPWWLPSIPMLLPPPIAAFAIWARWPGLHRVFAPNPTATVLLGAMLLLTIAPLPTYVTNQVRQYQEARREEAAREEAAAAEDARRRETLARFQTLTAGSPLWEWAPFIGQGSELDSEAVAGAKALPHKQADAEEALRRGLGFPLVIFDRIDLEATPAFCTAAADFLRQNAADHPASKVDGQFRAAENDYEPYLEGIESLTRQHCDLDDAVARTREAVGGYQQTPSRDAFLAVLAWRRGNGFYNGYDNDRAIAEYDAALRLSPDNSQYYYSRGSAFYEQQQYDRAIADYTEAIRLNDGDSVAWDSRGNAYFFKGDTEQALRDYDAAIQRNPDRANAYNNRANVFVHTGRFDRAIEDYDKALQLDPQFRMALGSRGRTRLYQAAYAPAVEDLAAALALKPEDAYAVLWLYLARLRAGQPARDELREEAAKLDRENWPWPVVAVFLGDGDRATVLDDLRGSTADDRGIQQCEADFFFGAKLAGEGDATSARELLQEASAVCPAYFIEAIAAKFELARLPP